MRKIHELKKRSQAPCAKLSVQYYIETSNSDWPTQDQVNVFQKKVNCFANMSYQVHVIGLVMVPTLYQLAQLRVAFAKISWRAERWRSASTWFGCTLSSLGSMKRMIPFNKQHLLSKESAPFFNAPHLRVLSQNLPNKCQSLPNDAQSNADTVITGIPVVAQS